jgi:hypothetical protein
MTRRHVTKTVPVIGAPELALDISLFTEVPTCLTPARSSVVCSR